MNQGATHTNIIFILTKILFKTQSDIRMAATVQGREEEKLQVAGLLDQSFKPSAWSANRFCPSSHFLHLSPLSGRGKEKKSATISAKIRAVDIICVFNTVYGGYVNTFVFKYL